MGTQREMVERWQMADRAVLLEAAKWFIEEAQRLEEVERLALVGSICTDKPNPKDIDLLVTIRPGSDITRLAALARRINGRIQKGSLGSDVFIVEEGRYTGRTCHYREPWPRVVCQSRYLSCAKQRNFLCNTSNSFELPKDIIDKPPLVIWPETKVNAMLPADVAQCFGIS